MDSSEIYDYDSDSGEARQVRPFKINPDDPEDTYLELDELLASGRKIPPRDAWQNLSS